MADSPDLGKAVRRRRQESIADAALVGAVLAYGATIVAIVAIGTRLRVGRRQTARQRP